MDQIKWEDWILFYSIFLINLFILAVVYFSELDFFCLLSDLYWHYVGDKSIFSSRCSERTEEWKVQQIQ